MDLPTLDELIEVVLAIRPDAAGIDHLEDAVGVAGRVGELADSLVGHFVDHARRAGASWTSIGESLGVSKQGAQQRFTPRGPLDASDMKSAAFKRFTDRARQVVRAARDAAIARGDIEIRVEHMLLGICTDTRSFATRALSEQGATINKVRRLAFQGIAPPAGEPVPEPPFGADVRTLLELALRETLRFGHNYVGTEHLLLGLLSDDVSPVTARLVALGITYPSTRKIVVRMLQEY